MAVYFVKIRTKDVLGDDVITYRIIEKTVLARMLKDFSNKEYPLDWEVSSHRTVVWDNHQAFKDCLYIQDITDEVARNIMHTFAFNEWPWPSDVE